MSLVYETPQREQIPTLCPHCPHCRELTMGNYDDGLVRMEFAAHRCFYRAKPVELTIIEWALLECLVRCESAALSQEALCIAAIGSPEWRSQDPVKWHISNLRRKLPGVPIVTVRGFGYRYEAPNGHRP